MNKKLVVSIDLGGTNLKIALFDQGYKLRDFGVLSTKRFTSKDNLIAAITSSIKKILENNDLKKKDILGVGLGLPGPVNEKSGVAHFFPNIPGFKEVNLKRILEKKLGLPVFLDNDAKLMSLAEYKFGKASGFQNVLCITLGTGVGGAIIINGSLYRGKDNAAGEIGHLPINEFGPRCNCAGFACLEAYVGNNRIMKEAKNVFKRNVSLEELSMLAKQENQRALIIWDRMVKRLGVALVAAVNLLNLDAIVIGGGVSNAGKILFDKVKETVRERAMSVQGRRVRIFKAKLGGRAGLVGAAMLVTEKMCVNVK